MHPLKALRYLMFSDIKKIVRLARTKILQPEDMPALPAHLNPRTLPFDESKINTSAASVLIKSLFREGRRLVLPAFLLNLTFVSLNLTKPLLVNAFIKRISALSPNSDLTIALVLALSLGLVSFISSLAMQHYFLRMLYTVQVFTNTINRLVYKQSLLLTQRSRNETQLGDMVNHLGSDCDSVSDTPMVFGDLQLSLTTIVGAIVLLFYFLGTTAFLSVLLLLLMVPLTRKIARAFSLLDEELMKHRDQRVTLMSQVLNGIRVVKYFAWETSVAKEVSEVRSKELKARSKLAKAEAAATLSYAAVSTLVLFASLGLHVYRGFPLSPELAFTCVAIFAILEDPIGHLSEIVSRTALAFVSAERISGFLKKERLPALREKSDSAIPGLEVENISVQYPGNLACTLERISFRVLPGESVAIVGPVGSGKSTLLQMLLRELPIREGTFSYVDLYRKSVSPRIAYVPQEAFIVNGSLKENILFGGTENPALLQLALETSCLEADIPQLPAGLFTEIGEKGVNLSGGQKQRVSLARAVMHQPTLVFLDDPLSAVDARTEEQLVDRLLCGTWKEITRLVVTHRLSHLHRFDKIVFLDKGTVKEVGTLQELLDRSKEFRDFFADSAKTDHGSSLLSTTKETQGAIPSPIADHRVTEDEDRAVGAVKGRVYQDYSKALGGKTRGKRMIMIPLLLGTAVLAATLPLLQKSWLALSANLQNNKIENSGSFWHELASHNHTAILLYGALGLCTLLGVLANRLLWLHRGMAAGRDMHNQMLHAVLRAPIRFFDSTPIGRVLQRFSRDVEAVDIQLQWSFETTVRCLVNISTALFLILGVLPVMAVVILPILWLYYLVQRDYRIPAREAKRLDSISRSPRFAHFKETLQGLPVIRSFGKADVFLETFYEKLEHGQRMFHGHYMLNRWFSSRIPLLGGVVASATGVGVVFYAHYGMISPGVAGLVTIYAISLWESLNWAVRVFAEVEARMTSVERLKYYASLESEKDISQTPAPLTNEWPEKGEVVFDRVQARYANHLPAVLKDISFRIPAGSRVGVIGRTGSGKSTILQALFRCMELEAGEIRIDGVNIAAVPLARLRRNLAIIPQDPTLFLGTLRSNLDRYGEYTNEELWQALRKARLEGVVKSHSLGLDAPVAENGSNLSQGQRQLLCLARALLLEAKVIVMDEATASVDVQTDSLVQEVVRESSKGVTMLIIAHRLGTVADCDLILEVREGKIHRSLDMKKQEQSVPTC